MLIEKKKREKSSSSGVSAVSNESSSSEQLSSDLSFEVSSALPTLSSTFEQEEVEAEAVSHSALRALQSSLVLPDSWSDQSPDGLDNILLCRTSNQASCT